MQVLKITRENISLLSTFFNYEQLRELDTETNHQVKNLITFIDCGKNFMNVADQVDEVLDFLNKVLASGKLFQSRSVEARLDMDTDRIVKMRTYSVKVSRIVPGWYYPTGRICATTNRLVWWNIASKKWEARRLRINGVSNFKDYLSPPEQTAGYILLAYPEGEQPPKINQEDEELIELFISAR